MMVDKGVLEKLQIDFTILKAPEFGKLIVFTDNTNSQRAKEEKSPSKHQYHQSFWVCI